MNYLLPLPDEVYMPKSAMAGLTLVPTLLTDRLSRPVINATRSFCEPLCIACRERDWNTVYIHVGGGGERGGGDG